MAAILTDRLLNPRAGYFAAVFFAIPRANRRRSIKLSAIFTTIWRVMGEWLALLWLLGVVAFSLLITASAAGLLA